MDPVVQELFSAGRALSDRQAFKTGKTGTSVSSEYRISSNEGQSIAVLAHLHQEGKGHQLEQ